MSVKSHPLLLAYLKELNVNPLRTKMITSGLLSFIQEVLASHLAGASVVRSTAPSSLSNALVAAKIDSKAIKMAIYGCLISAPMGHVLVGTLQKVFAGKTSTAARFGQVIASNLFVAPIQTAVYLACISIINGIRQPDAILHTVRTRFFQVLKVSWVTSPVAIIIAQNFLPPELWVPWFNLVTFVMGTYLNTKVKKLTMAAQKKAKNDQAKAQS